jgi:protein arginine N-methyltransferase 1
MQGRCIDRNLRDVNESLIRGDAYGVGDYGAMIAHRARTNAYRHALERCVHPDSVVLDIGTGPGTFAFLAWRLGARRVIAVEPDDVIEVAREIAVANGVGDSIDFVQGVSTTLQFDEPIDLVVSDLRGALPLYGQHIPTIIDARTRLLAPGGAMIPIRDVIWATVVEEPKTYGRYLDIWRQIDDGLTFEVPRRMAANEWWTTRLECGQIMAAPLPWATLDYRVIEDPSIEGSLEFTIERAGTAHGVGAWFDAELIDGISFSGAPGETELAYDTVYSNAFFPFAEPLEVSAGDMIIVDLHADLVGADYIWRWETSVRRRNELARVAVRFEQSSFFGRPVSRATLERAKATHVPTLTEEGRVLECLLARMSNGISLGDVAEELQRAFPARFATRQVALDFVARLSSKYWH